jgi:negative regulator of flagellin synthesis FlgM
MTMSVPPSIPPRLRLSETGTEARPGTSPETVSPGSAGSVQAPPPAADAATLSETSALQMGETLAAKGPPFDLETVARIKEAIAEGRYPIDTKAISESLFAGLSDLNL